MDSIDEEKTRIELLKFELQEMYTWKRLHSQLRRRDLLLFTGVQGAVIGVISDSILTMEVGDLFLSIFAFVVAYQGYLISERAGKYVEGFTKLAADREAQLGLKMSLDLKKMIPREDNKLIPTKAWKRTTLVHKSQLFFWITVWFINAGNRLCIFELKI